MHWSRFFQSIVSNRLDGFMLDVKAMCRIRWMDHKQTWDGHSVKAAWHLCHCLVVVIMSCLIKKKQRSEPASWSFSSSATTRIIVFRIRIRALDVLGIHNLQYSSQLCALMLRGDSGPLTGNFLFPTGITYDMNALNLSTNTRLLVILEHNVLLRKLLSFATGLI
jgi:hypothetical protein